jgi:hypothetical protein
MRPGGVNNKMYHRMISGMPGFEISYAIARRKTMDLSIAKGIIREDRFLRIRINSLTLWSFTDGDS